MKPEKNVILIGASGVGKRTVIGALLYKCGGIDLRAIEGLERQGLHDYKQSSESLLQSGPHLSFETPRYRINLRCNSDPPKGLTPVGLASNV
jgi:hypothetical protein